MSQEIRWIFIHDSDTREIDEANHGTCVLSMAVSPMFGTAKNAKRVMVKMPFESEGSSLQQVILREDYLLEGLYKILDEVRTKGLKGKAVLNLSLGCKYRVLKTQFA